MHDDWPTTETEVSAWAEQLADRLARIPRASADARCMVCGMATAAPSGRRPPWPAWM